MTNFEQELSKNFSISSSDINTFSPDESLEDNEVLANPTIVYIQPVDPDQIQASEIASMFIGDWSYSNDVQVQGYTATDDLWTVVGYQHIDSKTLFDNVRLNLYDIPPNTDYWEACIQDILDLANNSETQFEISIK